MGLIVHPNDAFNWPKKLDRILDRDGAFRNATLIAVMRVMAPMGDVFVYDREDETGTNAMRAENPDLYDKWLTQLERGDVFPPDFSASDSGALEAYRAMNAFFFADLGLSNAEVVGGICQLSAVRPGATLFSLVGERGEREFELKEGVDFDIEKAAKKGEVNCIFASKHPYRYWWSLFNRAIYTLTTEYPLKELKDIVYEKDIIENEDGEGIEITYDKLNVRILPYWFKKSPLGKKVMTPDELCVDWSPHENGEVTGPFVNAGDGDTYYFISPGDIDFENVFMDGFDRQERGTLRELWAKYVHSISGKRMYQDEYIKESFKDAIGKYWLGDTEPKYRESGVGLLQLFSGWNGSAGAWRDEFPYHGYAAMIAYLRYFEENNNGFAIEVTSTGDGEKDIQHLHYLAILSWEGRYTITSEDIEKGYNFTVDANDISWSEGEMSANVSTAFEKLHCRNIKHAPTYTCTLESPTWRPKHLFGFEYDNGLRVIVANEDTAEIFEAISKAASNDEIESIIPAVDLKMLVGSEIVIYYSSVREFEMPTVSLQYASEYTTSCADIPEAFWEKLPEGGLSDVTNIVELPHVSMEDRSHSGKLALLEENTYCFVQTTKNAAIKKFKDLQLSEQVIKEAELDDEDVDPIRLNGYESTGSYDMSLGKENSSARWYFGDINGPKYRVRLPNGKSVQVPQFTVESDDGVIFPPKDPEQKTGNVYLNKPGTWAVSGDHDLDSEGESLYEQVLAQVKNNYSKVNQFHAISFVPPYKRDAIWGTQKED
ncbi:MAG: hypothetical protein J6Q84_03315 [Kiritimatiellae bacterium]|nr:hypothetical protein [Kiritimatiellia bacterium]